MKICFEFQIENSREILIREIIVTVIVMHKKPRVRFFGTSQL